MYRDRQRLPFDYWFISHILGKECKKRQYDSSWMYLKSNGTDTIYMLASNNKFNRELVYLLGLWQSLFTRLVYQLTSIRVSWYWQHQCLHQQSCDGLYCQAASMDHDGYFFWCAVFHRVWAQDTEKSHPGLFKLLTTCPPKKCYPAIHSLFKKY